MDLAESDVTTDFDLPTTEAAVIFVLPELTLEAIDYPDSAKYAEQAELSRKMRNIDDISV